MSNAAIRALEAERDYLRHMAERARERDQSACSGVWQEMARVYRSEVTEVEQAIERLKEPRAA